MKINQKALSIAAVSTLAIAFAACSPASTNTAANVGNKSANSINNTANSNPNANSVGNNVSSSTSTGGGSLASPKETVNTFYDGLINRDEAALRRALSKKVQAQIDEALAKAANDPEMKKRGITNFTSMLNAAVAEAGGELAKPDIVDEKISGETAVLQIKSQKSGVTAPVTLIKEAGEWKVAMAGENAAAQ